MNKPRSIVFIVGFWLTVVFAALLSFKQFSLLKAQASSWPTVYEGVDYSSVYDFNYYIQRYADVRYYYSEDPAGALRHFVLHGMQERRRGNEAFDLFFYKNVYLDLFKAFGDDYPAYYLHYIRHGQREGRQASGIGYARSYATVYGGIDYSKVYDFNYYLNHHADLRDAFGMNDEGALRHFVIFGMREGRQATANFQVQSYKNAYVDLRKAFGNDLSQYYIHYIRHGYRENRVLTKNIGFVRNPVTVYEGKDYREIYSFEYYSNYYKDIKRAYGNDDIATLQHFVTYGIQEQRKGRAPSHSLYPSATTLRSWSDYGHGEILDVSEFQENIRYEEAAAELKGVILRVGYTGYSSHRSYQDELFEQHYQGFFEQGTPIGVYYFACAVTEEEVLQELAVVKRALEGKLISLPVYYDMEHNGGAYGALSKDERTRLALLFLEGVKKMGYRPGVYTGIWYSENKLNMDALSKYPLWIAQYNEELDYTGKAKPGLWQYTSNGKLSGIDERVDLSYILT